MFEKIPGNVIKDFRKCSRRFRGMLLKIPGNAWEDFGDWYERLGNFQGDSGECCRGFRGMFEQIPGNVRKDSGECSSRFRGMFKKIPVNLNFDFFLEILLVFHQILLLNCYEKMKNNNYWAIFLKKTNASLCLVTSLLSLIT